MKCSACDFDSPQWDFDIRHVSNRGVCRNRICRCCCAKRLAQWRMKNPAKLKAQTLRFRARHKTALRIQKRDYWKLHPEKRFASKLKWQLTHPIEHRRRKNDIAGRYNRSIGIGYVRQLLRSQSQPITKTNEQHKRITVKLWRTKPLFQTLLTASQLSQ